MGFLFLKLQLKSVLLGTSTDPTIKEALTELNYPKKPKKTQKSKENKFKISLVLVRREIS